MFWKPWRKVMLNTGYQSLPALRAGALYYLMVAWSAVLGVVMLHETLDIISCSGSLFIFVGGIMPSIRKALKDQSQRESSTAS